MIKDKTKEILTKKNIKSVIENKMKKVIRDRKEEKTNRKML